MKNLKVWIGIILYFAGFIGVIACAIAAIVFAWQNPDMTNIRRFLEYPDPTVWCIVDAIAMEIGQRLVKG